MKFENQNFRRGERESVGSREGEEDRQRNRKRKKIL
jgi:hypothetical protein